MGLGGPVWHASVGKAPLTPLPELQALARSALEGVGDVSLGEWYERGTRGILHHRRRLNYHEQLSVGDVRDIRHDHREVRSRVDVVATETGFSRGWLRRWENL